MTVVIGTAGHIDHGKTSLLRALTGIDADRLPEERERALTIDVGYAHLDLDDGTSLDFVDVPGHERYLGNMLVGAGEIDAAMLVVAADDGPRPQTIEHLELLDALGIADGIAVVTKIDAVPPDRARVVAAEVSDLLAATALAGSDVLLASSTRGDGVQEVAAALRGLRERVIARRTTRPAGPMRLAIDRAFSVKGRGAVVTGSLRGGSIGEGERLRIEPDGGSARVRGLQAHNTARSSQDGGRVAANLAGVQSGRLRRGQVLTRGAGIERTDRLLAILRPIASLRPGTEARVGFAAVPARSPAPTWPPTDGVVLRLHVGTDQVDAIVRRGAARAVPLVDGAAVAELRLGAPIATFVGDRAVLRQSSPGRPVAGVVVLDPHPPRGPSRRRVDGTRIVELAAAVESGDAARAADAVVGLHGAASTRRLRALAGGLRVAGASEIDDAPDEALVLAPDVTTALEAKVLEVVRRAAASPLRSAGTTVVRASALRAFRRLATIDRDSAGAAIDAVDGVIESLVARRRLARDAERLRDPALAEARDPRLDQAMDRLEATLSVAAPPRLAEAARAAGCPPEGVRALLASGRIVRLDDDLAWATETYHGLARIALDLATPGPLTPAALRDATGTSRRFVLAILEDLDRREILRRTPDGHVPGPRAPKPVAAT